MNPSLQSIYYALLYVARHDGWRVIHCRVPNDSFGDIHIDSHIIRIDKNNSLARKITTLAHELGHAAQYKEVLWSKRNKYVKISKARRYRLSLYKWYLVDYDNDAYYTRALMSKVQFCEVDASRRGKIELIKMFPDIKKLFDNNTLSFEELGDKESLRLTRESWKTSVFRKPKKSESKTRARNG